MIDAFGADLTVYRIFFGVYLVLVGLAACAIGQAVANTWRTPWHLLTYAVLLGATHRFLVFALFQGRLDSIAGFLVDFGMLALASYIAYLLTRAHRMVTQYPWLYVRSGFFGWREKGKR